MLRILKLGKSSTVYVSQCRIAAIQMRNLRLRRPIAESPKALCRQSCATKKGEVIVLCLTQTPPIGTAVTCCTEPLIADDRRRPPSTCCQYKLSPNPHRIARFAKAFSSFATPWPHARDVYGSVWLTQSSPTLGPRSRWPRGSPPACRSARVGAIRAFSHMLTPCAYLEREYHAAV